MRIFQQELFSLSRNILLQISDNVQEAEVTSYSKILLIMNSIMKILY